MRHTHNIKPISANINSLVSNAKRIALTLLSDKQKPDIMLLSETHLNEKHTLYFKDYKIIRNDRPNGKAGGGTAILIKNNIKHEIIDTNTETDLIESTAIKLDSANNNKLILVSIYAKKGPTSKFRSDLEKLFNKLNLISQTNYYIIAGDFNAKHVNWSNKMNDERGINLQDWLNNNDIKYRINLFH